MQNDSDRLRVSTGFEADIQAVSDFFLLAYSRNYISHDASISQITSLYRNKFETDCHKRCMLYSVWGRTLSNVVRPSGPTHLLDDYLAIKYD